MTTIRGMTPMAESNATITVNVNIDLTPGALEAIVSNAKKVAGRNAKGHYAVDTADKVSEMISCFLLERDFEAYAKDMGNYTGNQRFGEIEK